MRFVFLLGVALSGLIGSAQSQQIVGKARVIDGNRIDIAGQTIRLFGVDAPDTEQTCMVSGRQYACGQNASFALSQIVGRHWVYCHDRGRDGEGRILAVCNLAGATGPEVNGTLVVTGWALANRGQSTPYYVGLENQARQARAGLWQGEFVAPSEWRQGKRLAVVPDSNAPASCRIKGVVNKRGELVYHLPGGQHYNRIRIDSRKGERWFCTEVEARAKGWRRSRR